MTPTKPDTPEAGEVSAAKARLDKAATVRNQAIEAAHRAYWAAVKAEMDAKTLTQRAVAEHLDFSREHIRNQVNRYTADQ
ncbi:hypothetical protein OHA84_37875 (plasmid) [Streptomyces sp. NBC_00513]|uniref:hypothetical protein n=1 Tax=unclassified Streptomyces TaxID=2593676 RepID=UPI00225A13E0|nr:MULTISPECIES: hypothetical protein [unclassified Streptomyces]MCX5078778.1 hypothetical protein [Streptomyces sp. NBC_00424]WUD46301.1 hypothetical protein OHA84_37875 [Streptomyces sp. NBC_00513]